MQSVTSLNKLHEQLRTQTFSQKSQNVIKQLKPVSLATF